MKKINDFDVSVDVVIFIARWKYHSKRSGTPVRLLAVQRSHSSGRVGFGWLPWRNKIYRFPRDLLLHSPDEFCCIDCEYSNLCASFIWYENKYFLLTIYSHSGSKLELRQLPKKFVNHVLTSFHIFKSWHATSRIEYSILKVKLRIYWYYQSQNVRSDITKMDYSPT